MWGLWENWKIKVEIQTLKESLRYDQINKPKFTLVTGNPDLRRVAFVDEAIWLLSKPYKLTLSTRGYNEESKEFKIDVMNNAKVVKWLGGKFFTFQNIMETILTKLITGDGHHKLLHKLSNLWHFWLSFSPSQLSDR